MKNLNIDKEVIRELAEGYKDAEDARMLVEVELADEIAGEKDPNTGKARYSNAEQRNNELTRRKITDPRHREAYRAARDALHALKAAEDERAAMEGKFKACRYVLNIRAAKIALLASEHVHVHQGEVIFTGPDGASGKVKVNEDF